MQPLRSILVLGTEKRVYVYVADHWGVEGARSGVKLADASAASLPPGAHRTSTDQVRTSRLRFVLALA